MHAVYRFWGDDVVALDDVIAEVGRLSNGGTLAVLLALHALERGFTARLYTANLRVFDPTWFDRTGCAHPDLEAKLERARASTSDERLSVAMGAYRDLLARGGTVRMVDPTPRLIARHLEHGEPILAGLSSTWLYRAMRVSGPNDDDDDFGQPQGHFVVLTGYDPRSRLVRVADPTFPIPVLEGSDCNSDRGRFGSAPDGADRDRFGSAPNGADQAYAIGIERLIGAILLGIVTDDADLLVLSPEARSYP